MCLVRPSQPEALRDSTNKSIASNVAILLVPYGLLVTLLLYFLSHPVLKAVKLVALNTYSFPATTFALVIYFLEISILLGCLGMFSKKCGQN